MMNSLHVFNVNETVQAVDVSTCIWEKAKIISIVSDWSVKVKWVDWSQYAEEIIEVPVSSRERGVEHWNIRKWIQKEHVTVTGNYRPRRKSASEKTAYRSFAGNPGKLTQQEQVKYRFFIQIFTCCCASIKR